jgi:hypothetical protein
MSMTLNIVFALRHTWHGPMAQDLGDHAESGANHYPVHWPGQCWLGGTCRSDVPPPRARALTSTGTLRRLPGMTAPA